MARSDTVRYDLTQRRIEVSADGVSSDQTT